MTRQEQFRAEMAALLKKYKVEMDVEESGGYQPYATAITFWSYAEYDDAGEMTASPIDFKVGTRSVDHTDFE
jgi:hypothetical protein